MNDNSDSKDNEDLNNLGSGTLNKEKCIERLNIEYHHVLSKTTIQYNVVDFVSKDALEAARRFVSWFS
jgi:hypothetical protein